jgi:hypothetical protein
MVAPCPALRTHVAQRHRRAAVALPARLWAVFQVFWVLPILTLLPPDAQSKEATEHSRRPRCLALSMAGVVCF